ncbi:MAG TPA: hypothetical protein VGF50_06610 [Caulobacteraceae bacterium]|jgi:hypothetical protein
MPKPPKGDKRLGDEIGAMVAKTATNAREREVLVVGELGEEVVQMIESADYALEPR